MISIRRSTILFRRRRGRARRLRAAGARARRRASARRPVAHPARRQRAGAPRAGGPADALRELRPGGGDGGARGGQHQYPHRARGGGRTPVEEFFGEEFFRRFFGDVPGARAAAAEPGLRRDRGRLRHRAHQCPRGGAGHRHRGGHRRRQEAQGQAGGRGPQDRSRRAAAPGQRALSRGAHGRF